MEHKGWYSRGYLPHFDSAGCIQFITFRLADSLPEAAVQRTVEQTSEEAVKRLRQLEGLLDAGHGSCLLAEEPAARFVQQTLLHFDSLRYKLFAWCIMPNHVHAVMQPRTGYPLNDILHSWKSFSAVGINRMCRRQGRLWQPETFDRYIRDERHLAATIDYVERNPVKAGLVETPEQWPWSSARRRAGAVQARMPALPGARNSGTDGAAS